MTRVTTICAVVLLAVGATRADQMLTYDQSVELFAEGNVLFRQANDQAAKDAEAAKELYLKAAMRFERIAESGQIHNGKLYYNTGNAYFRMGNLGMAILNYRRAKAFIPNDLNLQQNLTFARSRCVDKIGETQEKKVLKTLFFWHYDLAGSTRAVLFAIFFVCIWVCAAVRIFARRVVLLWILTVVAIASVLLFGSLLAETVLASDNMDGVITATEVIARKGDGQSYQPSFREPLHAGTEFVMIEDRRDWLHIELGDGRQCWIRAKNAGLVKLD